MTHRLIVIGGVAAGMSAAAKAKRVDRDLEVVVYEKGPHISYGACGMPYFIAGDIPDPQALIVRTPEQMAKQGVEVHLHHEVTAIEAEAQTVTVRDLGGAEFSQEYSKLVIATGARAAQPPLANSELPGIFALRSLESGLDIKKYLVEQDPAKAVVVGGGYIGVEMAETFRRLGLDVTMVIRSGQVMRTTLDDDVRELVHDELARHGVEVVESTPVAFEGKERVKSVVAAGGRCFPCDLALLGLGALPNVEMAAAAGVALGPTGAIAADEQMRTNLPNIYAAGDCCQAMHLVTGKPAYIPLGSTANKQGRVAGENAGGGQATFGGVVGTMVVRCFDLVVATTGLTAAGARAEGLNPQETMIRAKDVSHYFPGAADIYVKLIADEASGRLLGGQIVGQKGVAKRIDVLATALQAGMTVADLRRLDLSYAPPFAPVWDPILVAANVAAK